MARHLAVVVLVIAIAFTRPVSAAITAGDVLEKMPEKEQYGYITGAIDMVLYLEQLASKGSTPRSKCILDWYYGTNAPGPRQVVRFFDANRDKPAVGLLKILMDRACGK